MLNLRCKSHGVLTKFRLRQLLYRDFGTLFVPISQNSPGQVKYWKHCTKQSRPLFHHFFLSHLSQTAWDRKLVENIRHKLLSRCPSVFFSRAKHYFCKKIKYFFRSRAIGCQRANRLIIKTILPHPSALSGKLKCQFSRFDATFRIWRNFPGSEQSFCHK